MSSFLVDTDWIIEGLRGNAAALATLEALATQGLSISVITYGELFQVAVNSGHMPLPPALTRTSSRARVQPVGARRAHGRRQPWPHQLVKPVERESAERCWRPENASGFRAHGLEHPTGTLILRVSDLFLDVIAGT